MTGKVVTARLDNGLEVLVEVDEPEGRGATPVGIGMRANGSVDLDSTLANVKHAAGQVLESIRSIAVPPDSCEISFGVKLSGSMGAIIAKASTEANFTIKMSWSSKGGGQG